MIHHLWLIDRRKTVSASLNRAMDTPATEAYRGIHGAETGRINRLVFSIKYFELENRQRATVREFESHRLRQLHSKQAPFWAFLLSTHHRTHQLHKSFAVPAITNRIAPWYYRVVPLLAMSLLDDPAMLALAFC